MGAGFGTRCCPPVGQVLYGFGGLSVAGLVLAPMWDRYAAGFSGLSAAGLVLALMWDCYAAGFGAWCRIFVGLYLFVDCGPSFAAGFGA